MQSTTTMSASNPYRYYTDNYIFSDTSSSYLSSSDLSTLNATSYKLALNEIYARHGRVFKNSDLSEYFYSKPWYYADSSYSDSRLSDVERANIDTLVKYGEKKGWR